MHKANQSGMTGIGWLVVLGLIVFFALMAIRIGPIYMQAYEVKSSLKALKNEPFITKKTKAEVVDLLNRQFDVNGIDDVDPRTALSYQSSGGVMNLGLTYQVRRHLMGNLDVVASFDFKTEIVAH